MNIGIVVAMQSELDPFLVGKEFATEQVGANVVYSLDIAGKQVFITKLATVGEICAAACTQMLISRYDVSIILNFGVVGALTDNAKLCDVVVVDSVVHYDMDTTAIDDVEVGRYTIFDTVAIPTSARLLSLATSIDSQLTCVRCASADKFVEDISTKHHIASSFGAQICDMELAGIVITASMSDVEVLSIKAISDSLVGDGGEFVANLTAACSSYVKLVNKILSAI